MKELTNNELTCIAGGGNCTCGPIKRTAPFDPAVQNIKTKTADACRESCCTGGVRAGRYRWNWISDNGQYKRKGNC